MAYIVCTSNLDLVSFLFVPALYSTLKLEIFLFIIIITNSIKESVSCMQIVYYIRLAISVTNDKGIVILYSSFLKWGLSSGLSFQHESIITYL